MQQNPLYCDIEINDQRLEGMVMSLVCVYNDESMVTESDQPDTESEPMDCSSDELFLASHKMKSLAFQNGFTNFDVPISHQLQTSDVCSVDSIELRHMVASHVEPYTVILCCTISRHRATY